MLVNFAIEPAAMVHPSGQSSRDMQVAHKRLIKIWQDFGVLIDPGQGPDSISSTFDEPMLRPVRQIWRDAWKARERCRRPRIQGNSQVDWDQVNSSDQLAGYHDRIRLAFVETARGTACLGIPDDGASYSAYCGEVEAVLFPYAEQSNAFSQLLERSGTKVISGGTKIEQIWSEWFQPFARHAQQIMVLDRYLFSHRNVEGLCRILHFLNAECSGCRIVIYASNPDTWLGQRLSRNDFITRIETELTAVSSKLGTLTIMLVRDDIMTRERYVNFDGCAFHVGHGLPEIFGESVLPIDQPCTLDATTNGFMKTIKSETKRIESEYNVILSFERNASGSWETSISAN